MKCYYIDLYFILINYDIKNNVNDVQNEINKWNNVFK